MKLNLGCGADIRPGYINMDAFYESEDVLKHDMTDIPWPFPDNHFKTIYASHVLEHVPLIWKNGQDVMMLIFDEMWRVLKPDGVLLTRTPLANSQTDYGSPQHYRRWSPDSAYIFGEGNYYSNHRWKLEHWELRRMGIRWPYLWPINGLGITSHLLARLPFLAPLLSTRDDLWMWWVPVPEIS